MEDLMSTHQTCVETSECRQIPSRPNQVVLLDGPVFTNKVQLQMGFLSVQLILLRGVYLSYLEYLRQARVQIRSLCPIRRQGNFRVTIARLPLPGQDELLEPRRAPLVELHHNCEY